MLAAFFEGSMDHKRLSRNAYEIAEGENYTP